MLRDHVTISVRNGVAATSAKPNVLCKAGVVQQGATAAACQHRSDDRTNMRHGVHETHNSAQKTHMLERISCSLASQ